MQTMPAMQRTDAMQAEPTLHSAIYEGVVRHRRREPVRHEFRYRLYMMYLDLDELAALDRLFAGTGLWSRRRFAPVWFRRRDHLGDPEQPLVEAARDLVLAHTGTRPAGPIRLLTHCRTFGYCFNPVSFYYCFDRGGRALETVIAEITNTPWGERFSYVLGASENVGTAAGQRFRFRKSFFVSPFMDMDVEYDWRFLVPGRRLLVHMENRKADGRYFDATLALARRELTRRRLAGALLRHPLMTLRVTGAIHLEALKLLRKRVPTHVHPAQLAESAALARSVVER